ncbi:DUF4097 family beta strand repeat-containing protein [Nonomuraea typhae]|uniref:DUF4097 family beta strand repeat-containing protein n=1 Tax=Nonomuraea typhae TaxID=2603600 RepID=A0ABW7YT38_9ACTN
MKPIVFAGALLASTAVLTGCGLASIGGPTEESVVNYDVNDKVALLDVNSGSGDIVVTETDRSGIRVTETLQWRNNKPEAEHKVEGDTLKVTYSCRANSGSCSVSYKIEVPKGLKVKADAGSGHITLRGLTGELEASAGSGDIEASDLGGKKVVADAGSGSMDLKYASAPSDVMLEAGSGDITLTLPNGPYNVSAQADSGDAKVEVANDRNSANRVTVEAGSGNINVVPG